MDINSIKRIFYNREPKPLGVANYYSVLLPLIYVDNEIHILYQIRSHNLDTQPGEISFPGGKVEEGEKFLDAAVRETCEELGLEKQNINIIGQLDYMITPYNFIIYPFVGILEGIEKDNIKFNTSEVYSLFSVPLKYFCETRPIMHELTLKTKSDDNFPYHLVENGKNYRWRTGRYPVYFYIYGEHIIWGITARITKNFTDILKGKDTK